MRDGLLATSLSFSIGYVSKTVITSLISRKGGVGKTTTAVNLAAALASRGHSVLLVDLDSQASASLSLGLTRSELAPSTADLILRGVPATSVIRPAHPPGLSLITGSVDLLAADVELGGTNKGILRLRQALEPVRGLYDHILLDCPPALSVVPTSALVASDAFIVPVVPQFLALEGVENLLHGADRLKERFGIAPSLLGLVLTLVDYRSKNTRETVSMLRERYGELVFAVEVRVNVQLAEAPSQGQPVQSYAPTSTGAEAYRLLAEEFLLRAERSARRLVDATVGG